MVPAAADCDPALKNQAAGLPRPGRQRAPARPRQLPRRRRAGQPRRSCATRSAPWSPSRSCSTTAATAGSWTTFTQQVLRPRLHPRPDRHRGPAAPHRRSPPTPARTSCAPPTSPSSTGVLHRDRPAQARHPADVLPLRLRARRQPHRAVQRRRPAGPRARLAADHLDRGGARQGPGLGPEDHRRRSTPTARRPWRTRPRRERHDHRLPRPLHDGPRRAHRLAGRPAARRSRRAGPRRPTRRSPTTRSARRSRPASCASWPSAGST